MDCRELECLIYIITIISYLNYRGIRAHQMYHNDEINSLSIILQQKKKKDTNSKQVYLEDIQTKISHQRPDQTVSPNS